MSCKKHIPPGLHCNPHRRLDIPDGSFTCCELEEGKVVPTQTSSGAFDKKRMQQLKREDELNSFGARHERLSLLQGCLSHSDSEQATGNSILFKRCSFLLRPRSSSHWFVQDGSTITLKRMPSRTAPTDRSRRVVKDSL